MSCKFKFFVVFVSPTKESDQNGNSVVEVCLEQCQRDKATSSINSSSLGARDHRGLLGPL